MNRNYSKELRLLINNILEMFKPRWQDLKSEDLCIAVYDSFIGMIIFNQSKEAENMLKKYGNDNFRLSQFMLTLITVQLYTDLYKKLIYKYEIGDLNIYEHDILNKLSSTSEYNQLLKIMNNTKISRECINATQEFKYLSAFEKILQIKSLNESDCLKLAKINPLYVSEKEIYDIKVDIDFIIKQIGKLKDHEKGYEDSVDFLFKLYKIRPDEAKTLIIKLLDYYNENGFEYHKINDETEEIIEIEDFIVSKNMLKELIKKYDSTCAKNKTLNYKNND